jgi:hypothetical protein
MCIFHLSKTHHTNDCHVKKECDKLRASKSPSSTTSSASTSSVQGQLRHLTDQGDFEDSVFEDVSDSIDDVPINDTNREVLNYFSRLTNHYLRLVWNLSNQNIQHEMKFPIIADSGAKFHMLGTVTCRVGNQRLTIENVRYVPGLRESIYSLFWHIQTPDHSLHSSFEDGPEIIFPHFKTKAILGNHDIYLDALPIYGADDQNGSSMEPTDVFCRNLKQFMNDVTQETKYLDNLLKNLHQYYKEIKTRRQLNLNVLAGFRQDTLLNREHHDYKSSTAQSSSSNTESLDSDLTLLSPFLPDAE